MPVMNGKGLTHFIQLFKNYFGITWSITGDTNDKMITAGEDLNNYTTIGNYYCRPDTDEAADVANNPAVGSFILKVYSGSGYSPNTSKGNYLTQYLENLKGTAWMRYKTTGSWSDWVQIISSSTDSVGSGTNPIYSSDGGVLTASSSGVGSGTKPIYLNNGVITVSGSTVGSATKPVYLNSGTFTESSEAGTGESITVTKSTQSAINIAGTDASGYDSTTSSGSGNISSYRYWIYTHTGISAGTYTVANLLQQLVNMSHTHTFVKDTYSSNCNCNCNCNCDSDGE